MAERDDLALAILFARRLGLGYKLDHNQETGVQVLTVEGKVTRFFRGREVK